MARERPRALILRRGPSAWFHLILWNTRDDTFEPGAWFKGCIYAERCDLSPEGDLFLYFALQGSRWATSYRGTWTAVSRPPWLHALTLWPQGDTWGGGGRFLEQRKVGLFTGAVPAAHPDHPATGLEVTVAKTAFRRASDFGGNDWAGQDQAGRDVCSRGGKLYRRMDGEEIEIADFTGLTPDPKPAPPWATKPLDAEKGRRARRT
jgi:hypothetical protein